MKALFGIPMNSIMVVMLVLLGVCLAVVVLIGLTNRTMLRLGLRNIPRRRDQSVLVVLGLMLSTLIITAAFTVGDSLDYSITRDVYDILRPVDETLVFKGGGDSGTAGEGDAPLVPMAVVPRIEERFAGSPVIEAFIPALIQRVPVFNAARRQSEPQMRLVGVDPERTAKVGGVRYADGRVVDFSQLPAGSVLINPKAADLLQAKVGDTIQILVNGRPNDFAVAGITRPELLTGWVESGPGTRDSGGITMLLKDAQALLGKGDTFNFLGISNAGGVREGVALTDDALDELRPVFEDEAGRVSLGLEEYSVKVEPSKEDGVKTAETFGNVFTTVFLILGLFSIAAGILLIFMIFVMLAAERRPEMGMSRAVGLKRHHLIETFIAEGMAYNLGAGIVGAALGVLAAYLLVVVAANVLFGDTFSMALRVTPRSLVISYALGVVLTFVTVAVSSWRVSNLNIVAAIRDLTETRAGRAGRMSLVWGLLGSVLGLLMLVQGRMAESAFLFGAGMTLLPLSLAMVARYLGASARSVFTPAGALIFLYWSLPQQWSEAIFGTLDGDVEMFFLSGIGMVTGSTLVLVYNSRLLTNLFQGGGGRGVWVAPVLLAALAAGLAVIGVLLEGESGDVSQLLYMCAGLAGLLFVVSLFGNRAQRFGPALKMAIAYPLANRFRTGMTIAMFSLIVFSITVMSTLTANFANLYATDAARGGWDITSVVNSNNPLPDFREALVESGFSHPDDIVAIGRTTFPSRQQELRLAGTEEWKEYIVIAADGGFFQGIDAKMQARAKGYESDAAVWDAVRTQPNLAVIDASAVERNGFGGNDERFSLADTVDREDLTFEPVQVEVHDPVTNKVSTLTVIGVVSNRVVASVIIGLYTNVETYEGVFGTARPNRVFMKVAPGVDAKETNREIKAALVTRGVQSFDLKTDLAEQQRLQVGFNRIFQGFMALGLFVGVAALGVIAFRSVVERRQQIGMLRAIGYQKGTVALSFILESSFVSVMGVLAGVFGATILSRNLFHSDVFTDTGGIAFIIPWLTVIGFIVAGFGFAFLMTWLPAHRASRLPIAEALRYE